MYTISHFIFSIILLDSILNEINTDWLSHCTLSAISVQGLAMVNKIATTFLHFFRILKVDLETNVLNKKNPEKTTVERGHGH